MYGLLLAPMLLRKALPVCALANIHLISMPIYIEGSKYLNSTVQQDHSTIKRITAPMLKFKSFLRVQEMIAKIETMYMVKKESAKPNRYSGNLLLAEARCIALRFDF